MTNKEMSDAVHIFYNPDTNCMASMHWRRDLEMYEVQQWCDEGRTSLTIMSMDSIIEKRKNSTWDFLGTL